MKIKSVNYYFSRIIFSNNILMPQLNSTYAYMVEQFGNK